MMMSQAQARIYLSNQRGCLQADWYRSFHTFNFGNYFSEYKKAFNNLQFLNDDTLKASFTVKQQIQDDILILLLPLVGALEYKGGLDMKGSLDVGQSLIFPAHKGTEFEISNPYKNELINYLYIGLVADKEQKNSLEIVEFDLNKNENKLISLVSETQKIDPTNISIQLGKFSGREEGTYTIKNPEKGIFVFIVEGAFEVQNRLLQQRDGLALWNTDQIEFEALSNDAIILLVE